MLLVLSGCVQVDKATGQPTGLIWNTIGAPMAEAIKYFATDKGLGFGVAIIIVTIIVRLIILPQAFRIILPPLTNQIVNLIKNTSTVAIISGVDLMFVTKSWSALNGNYIPAFLGAALLYFALCFPVAQFGRKMEQANKKAYSL